MLYEYLRVFKESAGTFTDLSLDNQEEAKTLIPNLSGTDFIYIAQHFPFNNMYIRTGAVINAIGNDIKVEYYDGREWREVVDKMDATAVSGASLGRSGVLQFSPNRDYSWHHISDTSDNNAPIELNSLTIYNCYWMRLSFPNGITTGTEIKEISYAFTDTQELDNIDIEISEYYESFATGKTDWVNEILTASRMLLIDLKRQGLVIDKGEVLRFDDVFMACTYKTLELIYGNLGPSYTDKRNYIRSLYDKALNIKRFSFDKDSDALLDRSELKSSIKRLVR